MNDALISKIIRNNFQIYKFASSLLWMIISKAKNAGVDNIESYIKPDISVSGDVIKLNKLGIPVTTHLLEARTYRDFLRTLQLNHVKFLQIMGAIYKFTYDSVFITRIVESDASLQSLILEKFRIYFAVPESFSFKDLQTLVAESKGDWFIPWLITYTTSSRQNLVRHNLNYDSDYIRTWIKSSATPKYYSACSNQLLKDDVGLCEKSADVEILKGNTYYQPVKGGIFENTMKKYNREVIAGPSGSSIMTYQLVFNILKICKGERDKVMLLLCIIGDYYPVHHSIPEILMIYPEEADLPRYDLSMDTFEYIRNLTGESIPELKFSFAFVKGECDTEYFDGLETFIEHVISESNYQPELVQQTVDGGIRSCEPLSLDNCEVDSFHPDSSKVQILLGRFEVTTNCFTACPGTYFVVNMPIWSIFRNDLFLHYIARKNQKLDPVFPIRIILSKNPRFFIPPYNSRIIKHLQLLLNEYFIDYTWDETQFNRKNDGSYIDEQILENTELESDMKTYSKFMNDDIKTSMVAFPSSNIISRELCILRKLYFYMVLKGGVYLPFILISHLDKPAIFKWYSDNKKQLDGRLIDLR